MLIRIFIDESNIEFTAISLKSLRKKIDIVFVNVEQFALLINIIIIRNENEVYIIILYQILSQ